MKKSTFYTLILAVLLTPNLEALSSTATRTLKNSALALGALAASAYLFKKFYWVPVKPTIEIPELHITTQVAQENPNPGQKTIDIEGIPSWIHKKDQERCVLKPRGCSSQFLVHKGLPNPEDIKNNTIFLYSGGWIGVSWCSDSATRFRRAGAGTVLANRWMKQGLIHGTVVTFDYATDPMLSFNLGQKDDIACLKIVYDAIVARYPTVNIVLAGDCKGGTAILNFLAYQSKHAPERTHYFKNLKAVALESVPESLHAIADGIAYQHLGDCGKTPLYNFMNFWIPHHNPHDEQQYSFTKIDTDLPKVPVLIGQVESDGILRKESFNPVIAKFLAHGCPVHRYVSTMNIGHADLSRKDENFCFLANAFFAQHGLPHKVELAHKGSNLLNECPCRES